MTIYTVVFDLRSDRAVLPPNADLQRIFREALDKYMEKQMFPVVYQIANLHAHVVVS